MTTTENEVLTEGERLMSPAERIDFRQLCAEGGHWCNACQRFVSLEDGPTGGMVCAKCGSLRVRFIPPVR